MSDLRTVVLIAEEVLVGIEAERILAADRRYELHVTAARHLEATLANRRFDVVLLDVDAHEIGETQLAVLRKIRASGTEAIASSASVGTLRWLKAKGFEHLVRRPYDEAELRGVFVAAVTNRRRNP